MQNPVLPHLLRAMANSQSMAHDDRRVIIEQAAIELAKLEKIYVWADGNRNCPVDIHTILYTKDSEQ